ncbi:16894_t:CDS:2 [Funneliformis geosporum]|nr:16894_t:CDS:2 [Funneliformis geosporum]
MSRQITSNISLPSHSRVSNTRVSMGSSSVLPKTPSSLRRDTRQVPVLEPKQRFIINKIILYNFKSYCGKIEIGPLHKSFSAIVGPNGSGKSNVIDALLFVFGYRANKMRQGRLAELIHSSQGCENLDSCNVDVHFEEILDTHDSDDYEVVPQSQLVISRQAFRNNASKYFINGRQSNYTEVTSLLKEKKVDLDHKRFLILQDRLGNLGVIDEKYDVAISTACPALNNFVVDSVEVGQTCVDHLRKNNLGRVIFILLNKLPIMDMRPIQTPENVPRLFDLVKPKDDKFIPAFYSVLQNTLVAENLQQAKRIAFGKNRWRVVTLNGELVDKSGTMSGGGAQVLKGAMNPTFSSDITPETITKIERERSHLEVQLREVDEKVSSLESQLQEKKDELPKLKFELSKLKMSADACVESITDNETRIVELRYMIALGGNAELECCDSMDPFSEGIIFSVMPPKKSWKNISNLSGGEKTLSSLALVFALHHYKPTPIYVMDEIDAALDFRNVSIVANYIKERTKDAQFIVVSLRDNMFELADHLVGVYKIGDQSKSVTINPRKFQDITLSKKS